MTDYSKYKPSPQGFARLIVDVHGHRLRYALDTNRFYKYEGTHWQEVGASNVEIGKTINSVAQHIADNMPPTPDKDDPSYVVQATFVKLAGTAAGTSSIISKLKEDDRIWCRLSDFSGNPYLLNFKDCTVDVRQPWMNDDGETEHYVHAHDPDDMLSTILAYSYPEFDEQPTPLWDGMLMHMCGGDPSYARSLEEALAYGLLGANPENLLVFLVGAANIGKTQALEIVTELAGTLGGHGKVELIQYTRSQEHDSTRADLRGKHFVMLGETSHRLRLDEMKFKDLTGAKSIPTRKLGQEPVDTRVTWTLYCATNELPEVAGEMDDAIARRMWVFPLPGKQISKADRDTHLMDKIIRQEGKYLLQRFAKHLSGWYATGSTPEPHAMSIRALDSYRAESNTVAEFCAVALREDEGGWVSYDDLNLAYAEFCKKRNITGVSRKQLPRKIAEAMITPERDSKHMRMKGVSVRFEAPSWA